jgi:cystathionine beta-lyase
VTDRSSRQRLKTRFVHVARGGSPNEARGVNPPVVRASTVLYPSVQAMGDIWTRRNRGERLFSYGARGTPTAYALEDAIAEIEGGARTMLFPTGLAAIAHTFLSLVRPGDHMLMADTIYGPARAIARRYLAERGVECEFYAGPAEVAIARRRPNTRMIYLDNPGSIVYDVQDVPALATACAGTDTLVVVDNTWGAPGLHRPLALGADVSIVALTKYVAGHSDMLMGSVSASARCAEALWRDANLFCNAVSPDDAYQVLRGLRTAGARLAMHQAHAMEVMTWLTKHPKVARVLCPALPADPGHALWTRDFDGFNGLFTVELAAGATQAQADAIADGLALFGLGASWGGYESLVITYPDGVAGWRGGPLVRLHVGLEDPADLIADLEQALARAFAV